MILNEIFRQKRIDELQGIRQHAEQDFQSKQDVVAYIRSKGFTMLGSAGMYGAVFDHPSFGGRYVLKVFSDPFYEQFLTWAATQNSPHLPKIVGKVMKIGSGSMVRIERLDTMSERFWTRCGLEEVCTEIVEFEPLTAKGWGDVENLANARGLSALFPILKTVSVNKPSGSILDFHDGNFMLRGKTIVLTDPYSGGAIPFMKPVMKRPRMAPPPQA